MRIVSLNAWGGQLWDALAEWVPGCGADVLLLQEVTRAPAPAPAWLEYRDAYRHLWQRADLFNDLRGVLPGWQAIFAPAARGPLSSDDAGTLRSEHGIAAFFAPHLAVTAQDQRFVHGDFRADGWGPEPVPRPMQSFRLVDPDAGSSLALAHFHGLRDASGKGDTPQRAAQAEAVVAGLRAIRPTGTPLVLAGDFNLLPSSGTFARLAEIGLRDLVTAHGITDTRTSHYRKPERFADYMLVTDTVDVRSFAVPEAPEVSDHRPLILDLGQRPGRQS